MKIIVPLHCLSEYTDSNAAYCFLNLDINELQKLRRLCEPLMAETGFYAASFFDHRTRPLSDEVVESDWWDEEADVQFPPDSYDPETHYAQAYGVRSRVEAATLRVKPDGFLWHFYEKHTDVAFETEDVAWDVIEQEVKHVAQ